MIQGVGWQASEAVCNLEADVSGLSGGCAGIHTVYARMHNGVALKFAADMQAALERARECLRVVRERTIRRDRRST